MFLFVVVLLLPLLARRASLLRVFLRSAMEKYQRMTSPSRDDDPISGCITLISAFALGAKRFTLTVQMRSRN